MSTDYHAVFPSGTAANAAEVESRFASLDAGIGVAWTRGDDALSIAVTNNAELVAARGPYLSVAARFEALVLSGGNVATKANGASVAGQKVLTVDATTDFVVGAYVTYLLNGTTLEGNTIGSIQAGVSLTLGTNIGTGGVLDDSYISMISISEYQAAQAIPHAGTLLLPQTIAYVNGGVYHVEAGGATSSYADDSSVAIQAVIDSMPSAGGELEFGPGYWRINTKLTCKDGMKIRGAGKNTTTILAYCDDDAFYFPSGATEVSISDLTISDQLITDYNSPPTTTRSAGCGIRFAGQDKAPSSFELSNIRIVGFVNGVRMSNVLVAKLSHVLCEYSIEDAFVTESDGYSVTANGMSFTSCYANHSGRHGFNIQGAEHFFGACNADDGNFYAHADSIGTVTVAAGGTGYAIGDILTVAGGTAGKCWVTRVNAGAVQNVVFLRNGYSYTTGVKATTKITGAGNDDCTLDITALTTSNGFNLQTTTSHVVLSGCGAEANVRGFYALTPNSIVLQACNFDRNTEYGLVLDGGTAITLIGIFTESNGGGTSTGLQVVNECGTYPTYVTIIGGKFVDGYDATKILGRTTWIGYQGYGFNAGTLFDPAAISLHKTGAASIFAVSSNFNYAELGLIRGTTTDAYLDWYVRNDNSTGALSFLGQTTGAAGELAAISATGSLDLYGDRVRVRTTKTPANAGAAGNKGDICWDSGFIYVCVDTNTWTRAAIATWP